MLELFARNELRIREHHFAVGEPGTLLYASDLHLNARGARIVDQVLATVTRTRPDLVLLGGDLADTPGGLPHLHRLITSLPRSAAIAGNHEAWVGTARVRDTVRRAGGHWLADQPLAWAGRRVTAESITAESVTAESGTGHILCAHDPAVFPQAAQAGYRLVLAGHLHGSQCVWAERRGRLYPGAWVFRWNGDLFHQGQATMIVSRGVNDTLPVRWNCPRDVVVCRFGAPLSSP